MSNTQSLEETRQQLRDILAGVEALQLFFAEMSRDRLLELWSKQDEKGRSGDPVHQFALQTALKRMYNVDAPLYPYDPMTPQQRFWLQPSSLIAATEQRVRTVVERDAAYAFDVLQRCGFPLDVVTQVSLIEARIRREMATNAHQYWRE